MNVHEAVSSVQWTGTNYIQPHEYFLFKKFPDQFLVLMEAIDKDGKPGAFQGRTYRYFFHDGFKYWRMGVVINRAQVKPAPAA